MYPLSIRGTAARGMRRPVTATYSVSEKSYMTNTGSSRRDVKESESTQRVNQ